AISDGSGVRHSRGVRDSLGEARSGRVRQVHEPSARIAQIPEAAHDATGLTRLYCATHPSWTHPSGSRGGSLGTLSDGSTGAVTRSLSFFLRPEGTRRPLSRRLHMTGRRL